MRYLMLVTVAAVTALAVACGGGDNTATTSGTQTSGSSASVTDTQVVTPSPHVTPSPRPSVCQANPAPATTADVVVDLPRPGQQVTSPMTVTGQINAFEATFQIAIKDAGGNDLATQTGHSAEGQVLSNFRQDVSFTVSEETLACIWVFQASAQNGSPSKVQQVPVVLMP